MYDEIMALKMYVIDPVKQAPSSRSCIRAKCRSLQLWNMRSFFTRTVSNLAGKVDEPLFSRQLTAPHKM